VIFEGAVVKGVLLLEKGGFLNVSAPQGFVLKYITLYKVWYYVSDPLLLAAIPASLRLPLRRNACLTD
jgi:hypothetical protein